MSDKLVTPKFLTKEMAKIAVDLALGSLYLHTHDTGAAVVLKPKRQQLHVVVLVPAMKDDRPNYADYPNYALEPVTLYEQTVGEKGDFVGIAQCKALQLWQGRNDGGTSVKAHLLFPGDTQYWGGVKRDGIVVSCSGIQAALDRLISGMTADILIAMAHETMQASEDVKNKVAFLT